MINLYYSGSEFSIGISEVQRKAGPELDLNGIIGRNLGTAPVVLLAIPPHRSVAVTVSSLQVIVIIIGLAICTKDFLQHLLSLCQPYKFILCKYTKLFNTMSL